MKTDQLAGLMIAFAAPFDPEAPPAPLTALQWQAMAGYLVTVGLREQTQLFQHGREESSLYFIEAGRVAVHRENDRGQLRMAVISSGSVLGEASFLGNMPRQASAQVASPGLAYALGRLKFSELQRRDPELALTIVQLAATTLTRRALNRRRRHAMA